jgi:hypothetical protein
MNLIASSEGAGDLGGSITTLPCEKTTQARGHYLRMNFQAEIYNKEWNKEWRELLGLREE